jgi:predicted Zn-dependent protease with MMP-like domain
LAASSKLVIMAVAMSEDDFDELIDLALAGVPDELARLLDNVVIMAEDWPPPTSPGLLGYYAGVPLTARDSNYAGALPDRIVIFRGPTLLLCRTAEEVTEQVRITVVHEIAHHFGIDDDRLRELGYD